MGPVFGFGGSHAKFKWIISPSLIGDDDDTRTLLKWRSDKKGFKATVQIVKKIKKECKS